MMILLLLGGSSTTVIQHFCGNGHAMAPSLSCCCQDDHTDMHGHERMAMSEPEQPACDHQAADGPALSGDCCDQVLQKAQVDEVTPPKVRSEQWEQPLQATHIPSLPAPARTLSLPPQDTGPPPGPPLDLHLLYSVSLC